jgi:molybdate transport system ATP-binding protein
MTTNWARYRLGEFTLDMAWSLEPGKVLVLFGPSGSGKTTTLRAIAGLVRPNEGYIEIGGQTAFDHAQRTWLPPHLRRVGYLPQEYHLFPHLDVSGNIAYGLGGSPPAKQGRVSELLESFRLTDAARRRVWQLSGGQRQRVALARAMAPRPAALLLDEPFSALDMELRRELRTEIRALLRDARIPIVLVTHDREEALALGDTVQVMDNGRSVAVGEPVSVLGHPPQARVARLVGVENLIPATVTALDPAAGSMLCTAGPARLEVPLSDVRAGDPLTIGIRASDIILASSEPRGLSARNRLPGRVLSVEPRGVSYEVALDCGIPLRCTVTYAALQGLGIAPGAPVWAVIKASSCFVVAPDRPTQ